MHKQMQVCVNGKHRVHKKKESFLPVLGLREGVRLFVCFQVGRESFYFASWLLFMIKKPICLPSHKEACHQGQHVMGGRHANFTRGHGQEKERKQLVCNSSLKAIFLVI